MNYYEEAYQEILLRRLLDFLFLLPLGVFFKGSETFRGKFMGPEKNTHTYQYSVKLKELDFFSRKK